MTQTLRVAIIGSGPSGFYAAAHLQKQADYTIEIDMYDRLPTPFGLVRGGVAPDHQKIKSVTKLYDRIALDPGFRFFGNVEFGTDITHDDIVKHYHAVIYAVGAQSDRELGIPGEDLPGSHAATEFVGWYNAHPDFRDYEFDLSGENVVVIGVGNVAIDVVRILAHTTEELHETDIANHALDDLEESNIRNIYVLGRRGPVQAKFTPKELKELGQLSDTDVIVSPRDMDLDPLSQQELDDADRDTQRNIDLLNKYADEGAGEKPRKIFFRFLTSPVEFIGEDRIEGVRIVRNELYMDEKRGRISSRPTDETEVIPTNLVFRSVGYRGVRLPDVPFYEAWGIIPSEQGRVMTSMDDGEQVVGEYVAGWIKRGPSGVIGTNKPDSVETVDALMEDVEQGSILEPEEPTREAVIALMQERDIEYVTYQDWLIIDEIERERGKGVGRPRVKFSRVTAMLEALRERKKKLAEV